EGTRPTLPWSPRISLAPQAALPLLDHLHADPTRYVTRSVANHLNDLAKIDPELVLHRLSQWQQAGRQQPQELDFITRHALRSLIKQGHPETLRFLGYPASPSIQITNFGLAADQVLLGQALRFELEIKASQATRLVVDYLIHFQNKQGKLKPKVFKLKNLDLEAGQVVKLQKQHPLRVMTTKALYPGQHHLELQINGQSYAKLAFELVT
ncbi:MAG: DNA alkylation repair protein, partial [Candidatus Melainabacteria bacterium HGW-Melainabacteria-1]